MDYASILPKYERLKHYIEFVNEQKFYEKQSKMTGGKRPSIIGKFKNLKPSDKFK